MPSTDLEATCTCGHTYDEHRIDLKGVHECTVPDCDCGMWEEEE